ncbi:MAG: peptidyl-tRNA hydrolase Pth2 [Nitrososphaeria archaeon]|jgi:PTH2 family peptidyl-tRNA hydrolase
MSLLIRTDLKMSRGKMVAQGAHAAVAAALMCRDMLPDVFSGWYTQGAAKIALKVNSESEMIDLVRKAESLGLITYIVEDMGLTEVPPGTKTAAAIGPGPESKIDQVTGKLKLL